MKKDIALLLSGVILTSFVLSGCDRLIKKTEDTDESKTQTEETEATEGTEADETDSGPTKLQQVIDLYNTKQPEGKWGVPVFADGIRGNGSYSVHEDSIYFYYSNLDSSTLQFNVDTNTMEVRFTFDLQFDDNTRYYGTNHDYIGVDQFESFIGEILEKNSTTVEFFDENAWAANEDKIKSDLPVYYSRLITLAAKAFPELGFGIEDLGIDFGNKYRNVDPTQATSTEITIKNDHKFEKGICKECGMLWSEYYYETLERLDKDTAKGEWHSIYGQASATMFSPSDYVQYSAYNKNWAELYYQYLEDTFEESCYIVVLNKNGTPFIDILFCYEMGTFPLEEGVFETRFKYILEFTAAPGEYDKVFESKESFAEYCTIHLVYTTDDDKEYDLYLDKTEAEIKEMFANAKEKDCIYYSKQEMIDRFWEDYQRILASMDTGMIWMDTSLNDIGINWKK